MATTTSRKSASNTSEVHAADIEAQINQLRDDIAALTKTVSSYGQQKANGYGEKAQRAGQEALSVSQKALNDARREFENFEGEFENSIRRNPLQAVGIAAGLGFFLAMITRN